MRQFEKTYLFKVSFHAKNRFSAPPKPVYVVQGNKKEAEEYAIKNVSSSFVVKSVTLLAEQFGDCFFSGDIKK